MCSVTAHLKVTKTFLEHETCFDCLSYAKDESNKIRKEKTAVCLNVLSGVHPKELHEIIDVDRFNLTPGP
jgi:hypothetical protein